MTMRPILFSGQMVLAILANRKTQTRRVVKESIGLPTGTFVSTDCESLSGLSICGGSIDDVMLKCRFQVGQRLWVKETFQHTGNVLHNDVVRAHVTYRADSSYGTVGHWTDFASAPHQKWWNTGRHPFAPSIFMPRWASRITLAITGVRVERLQEITTQDAIAEGIDSDGGDDETRNRSSVENYRMLWDSINGQGSWDANPWVWVVEFKRVPQEAHQ